jgi:hypothetical protein
MCQVISTRLGTVDFGPLLWRGKQTPTRVLLQVSSGSPNQTSTMVLLTVAGPKPNLRLDHRSCPLSMGESLSKVGGGVLCIDSKQAHSVFYLTISP